MKKNLFFRLVTMLCLLALIVPMMSFGISAADELTIASPSGNIGVKMWLDGSGRILFNVTDDDVVVLNSSLIGVNTDVVDLSSGFKLEKSRKDSVDETYANLSGSYSTGRNHANILIADFSKSAGGKSYAFTVEMYVYDDGFAYRYSITQSGGTAELSVSDETGYFAIPEDSKLFSEKISPNSTTGIYDKYNYEEHYYEETLSECIKSPLKYRSFPLLYTPDDEHWVLLSEAELYGDTYAGSALYIESDGKLGLSFAPPFKASTTVKIQTPFTSPFRCGIVGGLGDVVESQLIENVSSRREGDFSWVKPGVASWLWLSEGTEAHYDSGKVKQYIKLSADMGWEYILLDAGWQPWSNIPNGYYDWFPEVLKYAKEKGVGIFVWVHYTNFDTPEKRSVMEKWANDGIVGVKVDWFDSETPEMLQLYEDIYKDCEKYKLMVNIHGANKPTGERQYWPHVINREAVRGEEYNDYTVADIATWLFARGPLGPMDITPRILPYKPTTTPALQLAMCAHFESGSPTMSSFDKDYRSSAAKDFFMGLPSAWDDMHFIDGYPGKYSVVARRSGDDWYVTGVSAEKASTTVELDFVDKDGEYKVYLYTDDMSDRTKLVAENELDAWYGDSFDIDMLDGGGFAIKLVRTNPKTEEKPTKPTQTPTQTPTETPTQAPTEAPSNAADEKSGGCFGALSALPVLAAVAIPAALNFRRSRKRR